MKKIDQGGTAEIFEWENGQVLKLFHKDINFHYAESESNAIHIAKQNKLPVPDIKKIVMVNGRYGIILERLDGLTIKKTLRCKPWLFFQSARLLAKLHHEIHTCIAPQLPSQRKHMEDSIQYSSYISEEEKMIALTALHQLPDGNVICHGDFHVNNIILTQKGAIIIDWPKATCGNPIADVVITSIFLRLGRLPANQIRQFCLSSARQLFNNIYLKQYTQLSPEFMHQFRAWQLPVAATLLDRKNLQIRQQMNDYFKKLISSDYSNKRCK